MENMQWVQVAKSALARAVPAFRLDAQATGPTCSWVTVTFVFRLQTPVDGHPLTTHGHQMTTLPALSAAPSIRTGRVLLIEDRPELVALYESELRAAGHTVQSHASARPALAALRGARTDFDCMVTDYMLPDLNGLEILRIVQQERPDFPIVFITGHGDMQTTIEAMKHGAFDYLEKPIRPDDLRNVVGEAVARRRAAATRAKVAPAAGPGAGRDILVGRSPAMVELFKHVGRVAGQQTPVLITGATGSGKELVARAIHQNGPRAKAEFAAINCAAIPEALLESELFGHEKGAFTGATSRRRGLLETAAGGTVFLDEIGDMPRGLQAKLLRVLQEKRVRRVGGEEEVPLDVRIVSATHQDLPALIREKSFREDLYHRLAGYEIVVPALAQRLDDVPLLARYFIARYAAEFGLQTAGIDDDALALLRAKPWPGNIRQLQNVLRRALMLTRNHGIDATSIESAYAEAVAIEPAVAPAESAGSDPLARWIERELAAPGADRGGLRDALIEKLDTALVDALWNRTDGNRSRIAEIMGVTRLTLRRKMSESRFSRNEPPHP
jgi:DNA-binding NtrC family response regulator